MMSVSKVTSSGKEVRFRDDQVAIYDGEVKIASGKLVDDLYWLNAYSAKAIASVASKEVMAELWHRRFAHISLENIQKLSRCDMVEGLGEVANYTLTVCDVCARTKMARLPFDDKRPATSNPLERIHSDVCDKIDPPTHDGYEYFITFTDDHTHMTTVYLMRKKSETLDHFKTYYAMATSHFNRKIARIRCDNGGEYTSKKFKEFCAQKGIVIEYCRRAVVSGISRHQRLLGALNSNTGAGIAMFQFQSTSHQLMWYALV